MTKAEDKQEFKLIPPQGAAMIGSWSNNDIWWYQTKRHKKEITITGLDFKKSMKEGDLVMLPSLNGAYRILSVVHSDSNARFTEDYAHISPKGIYYTAECEFVPSQKIPIQ